MNTQQPADQEWIRVLGKGMVTIPKSWRDELGITEGDIIKAKKEGKRLIIEPQSSPLRNEASQLAPYRVYSDEEIDEFLKEDRLPASLAAKIRKDITSRTSS